MFFFFLTRKQIQEVKFETFVKKTLNPEEMKGKWFFEVRSKKDFKLFEEHLRLGYAHIDRGFNFLGKTMVGFIFKVSAITLLFFN